MERENREHAGAVLIGALAFVLIVSLLLAAVSVVALSYHNRAVYEADNAHAIQLADAGVNYQLRKISLNVTDSGGPCQTAAPCTDSVPGVPGTFSVYIRNEDGSTPWTPPNAGVIRSVGTVNGFSRAVEVRGTRKSIFDEYAIFAAYCGGGVTGLAFNGSKTTIVGNVGANCAVDSTSAAHTNGQITLCGPYAAGTTSGTNVIADPNPVIWPTVDQIANARFPLGGLAWLKAHNNNANLKQYASNDANLDHAIPAGFTSTTYSLDNNMNKLSKAPNGAPSAGLKTLICPPGDYYFEGLSITGNTAVMIDNRNGAVRIWVNDPTGSGGKDKINSDFYCADTTPSKFRLYYNKCGELTLAGTTTFYGGIYAWRSPCSGGAPSLKITGNSDVYGSIIAGAITLSGNSTITFPNDGSNDSPDDFSLWYGFRDSWREVPIATGAKVFPDGTSR